MDVDARVSLVACQSPCTAMATAEMEPNKAGTVVVVGFFLGLQKNMSCLYTLGHKMGILHMLGALRSCAQNSSDGAKQECCCIENLNSVRFSESRCWCSTDQPSAERRNARP